MKGYIILFVVIIGLIMGWARVGVSMSVVKNGDFSSAVDLESWTVFAGTVSEPMGKFALIGGSDVNGLEQLVVMTSPLRSFAFDFAFATQANAGNGGFPDSFFVSITTMLADGTPLDSLEILLIEVRETSPGSGVFALTVDPDICSVPPFCTFPTKDFVTIDPTVVIPDFDPGFMPVPGFSTSGRLTLQLSDPSFPDLAGVQLIVGFDVIDESDGFITVAAIDNVSLTAVPEPQPLVLLSSVLVGLALWRRGRGRT